MSLGASTVITFTVFGVAAPAGSKRSLVPIDKRTGQPFRSASGRIVVNTVDDNPKAGDWKRTVAAAARQAYQGPLLEGPLELRVEFVRVRPKGHYGTRKGVPYLKDSAPRWPTGKPDTTKTLRGLEDSLVGVLMRDDAQIVRQFAEKRWGDVACAIVSLWEL